MRQGGSVHRNRKGEAQKSAIPPADQARTDQLGRSGSASGAEDVVPGGQGIANEMLVANGKPPAAKIATTQPA